MIFNSELFKKFILPDCNRADFIISELKKNGIDAVLLPFEGKNHIYVKFPQSSYNPSFRIKTVIAHYDRMPDTPGANDNSFAVFCLIEFAKILNNPSFVHNIRLIFTDGEELSESGIENQGAFLLAKTFRRLKITDDFIFVFDCMGRGTIPILAKTFYSQKLNSVFKKNFFQLETKATKLISSATGKYLTLPVGYSDNAGFLAQSLYAVAITMLPENEANLFLYNLIKNPKLEQFVLHNTKNFTEKEKSECEKMLPYTWNLFHTQNDNFSSITMESFSIFMKILFSLAKETILF